MAIGNINNGELGSSVRNKLNQLVNAINNQVVKLTGNQTISGEKYFTDNVGIGTTSPSEKLEVFGTNPIIKIRQSSSAPGGSGIMLNAAGVNSSSNAAFVDFSRAQIWTQTNNANLYFGNSNRSTIFQTIKANGNVGIGTISPNDKLEVNGSFSATSKNFKIDHPLASKKDTHKLVHASIEAPRADLIYSGMVQLVDGTATVNIDTASNMTDGTFEALVGNVRRFCTNEGGFTRLKSSIERNLLTIEAEDPTCTDEIFWQVIGERKDAQILESNSTDDNGNLIVEPEIIVEKDEQLQENTQE